MPVPETPEELAAKARFVFRGTVQQMGAANIPEVRDTSGTAVVRVDQTIQAPPAMSHYDGKEITVQLMPASDLKAGDESVFFTDAWLFGNESIAVRSLGHHAPGPQTMALHSAAGTPVSDLEDRDTQKHFDEAETVVSGKVVSVRDPSDPARGPVVREHDPDWREAVVEVGAVHKGAPAKQIVVRFPASHDRAWHNFPKLAAGNEGHFMLHRKPGEDFYTLQHTHDFEPEAHPGRVERLLSRLR
jgi:hypothetical protein